MRARGGRDAAGKSGRSINVEVVVGYFHGNRGRALNRVFDLEVDDEMLAVQG